MNQLNKLYWLLESLRISMRDVEDDYESVRATRKYEELARQLDDTERELSRIFEKFSEN